MRNVIASPDLSSCVLVLKPVMTWFRQGDVVAQVSSSRIAQCMWARKHELRVPRMTFKGKGQRRPSVVSPVIESCRRDDSIVRRAGTATFAARCQTAESSAVFILRRMVKAS